MRDRVSARWKVERFGRSMSVLIHRDGRKATAACSLRRWWRGRDLEAALGRSVKDIPAGLT
jgi:hypothetical protein